jgi:uncharacterized protein YjbI with pentapeptide repeats
MESLDKPDYASFMANPQHLAKLKRGTRAWNKWRGANRDVQTNLYKADLSGAPLSKADLTFANLGEANLSGADLSRAKLIGAILREADLSGANLSEANLSRADLTLVNLSDANLNKANLSGVNLAEANLSFANLSAANLSVANLVGADLSGANLSEANLSGVTLYRAALVQTNLVKAVLSDCHIYGMSARDVNLDGAIQSNLVITPEDQPQMQVDNLQVAQFIYLLLNNQNVREVIDTIGRKGVLLLGRFTGGRMAILDRLREELRNRGFLPMVFNFDKPETKDFTETVRLLAGLSYFVIADITNPKSAPLELQATVPECMVPFVPILEKGEEPFTMLRDLWIKHRDWVLDPIRYPSIDRLVEVLDKEIINPAKARFAVLLARKAEELRIKDV